MNKFVIRDFLSSISFANIKRNVKPILLANWLFFILVWSINLSDRTEYADKPYLFSLPIFSGVAIDDKVVIWVIMSFYILWVSAVNMVARIKLPKAMYLVPASELDRKKYLKSFWRVKVLFTSILGLILLSVLTIMGFIDVMLFPATVMYVISLIICFSVNATPGSIVIPNSYERYQDTFRNTWASNSSLKGLSITKGINIFVNIIGIGIFFWEIDSYDVDAMGIPLYVVVYSIAIISTILTVFVARYVDAIVDMSLDYETGCKIAKYVE